MRHCSSFERSQPACLCTPGFAWQHSHLFKWSALTEQSHQSVFKSKQTWQVWTHPKSVSVEVSVNSTLISYFVIYFFTLRFCIFMSDVMYGFLMFLFVLTQLKICTGMSPAPVVPETWSWDPRTTHCRSHSIYQSSLLYSNDQLFSLLVNVIITETEFKYNI